ncbi:MAG: site-2 protease family protein [Acidimicrobiales bacterium]
MKDTVRLGRVRGIPVGLHWSLLAIAGLLATGLARNRLPFDAPGYSSAAYDVAGLVTAVALMGAVLLHELGHAVVARRAGLGVDGITLSWMGGVTRIEGESARPGSELAVSAVGPLVSFAAGGLLALVRLIALHAGAGRLLTASLGWLAIINLVLAVFNLFPVAPLDGGRVLHAAIWKATGDRWKASWVTSRAGVGVGALLTAVGGWLALSGRDPLDGLFLVIMGWWWLASARNEEQSALVHRALDGVRLADLMRPVAAAPGWLTVRAFLDGWAAHRPGHVWLLERWGGGGFDAVVAGDALAGVPLSQWDVLRPADLGIPVADVAGGAPGDDLCKTLVRTGGRQIILVVAEDHTVGAVLPSDVEAVVRSGHPPVPAPPPEIWRAEAPTLR